MLWLCLCDRCLEVNPKHTWAMCDLAVMMHAHCKDHPKAYELFTRSLEIDPTNVNSLCNRKPRLHVLVRST